MMEKRPRFTDFTIEAILDLRPKQHFQYCFDKENKERHDYRTEYIHCTQNSEEKNDRKKSSDVKKTRTVFTRQQLQYLENAFKTKKYFNCVERKKLADFLALTETQVKIWLQNRRNKWKKHVSKIAETKNDTMATQQAAAIP